MDKGVYILLVSLKKNSDIIGSLGPVFFKPGFYAYVGSALGTGGFARVKRHIRSYRTKTARLHWHIDYVLTSEFCSSLRVYCVSTNDRIECRISSLLSLEGSVIENFGSSDCKCKGHLYYFRTDPHNLILNLLNGLKQGDSEFHNIT